MHREPVHWLAHPLSLLRSVAECHGADVRQGDEEGDGL